MICPRWLSRARHRIAGHPASTARSLTRAATRPLAPDALARGRDGPAAASTRPLRSYSTPTTPLGTPLSADAAPEEKKAKSSVPAGALLTGLAYVKGADPPAAMEDDEYPAWLWGLLDETKGDGAADGAEERGDSYSKSRKMRKLAAKTALKAAKTDRQSAIPVEQQSIDLPAGDGTATGALEAMRAREEITEAMRRNRRKAIKEGNFLKNM